MSFDEDEFGDAFAEIEPHLTASLQYHEGWRESPYYCPTGHQTIGYGTRMPITKVELKELLYLPSSKQPEKITRRDGLKLLRYRLNIMLEQIAKQLPYRWVDEHRNVREGIGHMVYQLGVRGTLKFKRMHAAIAAGEYLTAKKEALDSRWAQQTPARAAYVATLINSPRWMGTPESMAAGRYYDGETGKETTG